MKKVFRVISIVAVICLIVWRLTCPALVRLRTGPMAGSTLILVPNRYVRELRKGPLKSCYSFFAQRTPQAHLGDFLSSINGSLRTT